jgi:hypothetical protein
MDHGVEACNDLLMQRYKLPTLFSALTESSVGIKNSLSQVGFALTGPRGPVRFEPYLPRDQLRR